MGRQRTPNEDSPASAFLKNWISEIPPPHPLRHPRGRPHLARDPGPIRRPRLPDSRFLEPFRPRHPTLCRPRTAALRPNLEHVAAGRSLRFSVSQFFGGSKSKFHEHTPNNYQGLSRAETRTIHFVCRISARYRQVSVRDRFGFGSISGELIR